MLRKFIPLMSVFLLMAPCAAKSSESHTEETVKKVTDPESLEFWTSDTILETNPCLVKLLDSLYQYKRGDFNKKSLDENIMWMRRFRGQLCNYYRETRPADSISEYAMADSILAEARNLWKLGEDLSTMGMVISNDVEVTRLIFEQFNEYEKLNSVCESAEQQDILLNEFTEWIKFEELFSEIFVNCVDLHFWGGSISGPTKTVGSLEIWQAHIDLYKKEYTIINNSNQCREDSGTFLNPAKSLLINCCNQAIEEYYFPDETDIRYHKIYDDTKNLLKQLPEQIDSWCRARQLWGNEMCTDWLRAEYPRHTSEVLIKLSNIISSVQ